MCYDRVMKNIYVVGIPRSGKSTLSRLIWAKYPEMNIISFEAVRNGFIRAQPELDMGNRKSVARREVLPQFLVEFVNWNRDMTGCGNIVEGSFAGIEMINNLVGNRDIVVCLGSGGKDIEEIVRIIKAHDVEGDYTKDWSAEQIKRHFYDMANSDQENRRFCEQCGIGYFNTFDNREAIFLDVLDYIEKQF